jgi:hypothetical protein
MCRDTVRTVTGDVQRWRDLLTALAPTLPGEWRVRGSGRRVVLVREPVEWTVLWLGRSQRRAGDPYLMSGVTPLVSPVMGLTSQFGLRSDEVWPEPTYRTVSSAAADAGEQIRMFFQRDAWPLMQRGSYEGHAEVAEQQLAQPAAARQPPWVFPDAAGWRVALETGSPLEPARQAIDKLRSMAADDEVAFYEGLVDAWELGGRSAALSYLQRQRDATLARLGLV